MDSDVLGRKGFSLIELSLMLAITAILLAIALYSAKAVRQAALAERTVEGAFFNSSSQHRIL